MSMPMQLPLTVKRNALVNKNDLASVFGDRRYTWSEFAERVARIAGGLQANGVGPGDRVAMLALNSDWYEEFLYATSWAGGVFVPINTRLAPPEVEYWLTDSGSKILIVDDNYLSFLDYLKGKLPALEKIYYVGEGPAPDGLSHFGDLAAASAAEISDRCGDDLCGLFYTGGTTGVSKGVMLSHGNLVFNSIVALASFRMPLKPIHLHAAPMFHLADGSSNFAISMAGGAHAYIPSFEPAQTLAAITKYKVTNALLVPVMVNMVINHPDIEKSDLSSLQHIVYGASPMPQAVLERSMELMPNVAFFQGYGQTETSPLLTFLAPERHVTEGPLAGKMNSVGQPICGIDLRILDEDDKEVTTGEIGEICVRGPNIMSGYLNKPELSAETGRNGWHHTGDGGYMDEDGFVFIVDRMKDMIISGGENVYSAEVENAIYQHPAVVEAAVVGVPDEKWGERVHAIVRLHEGQEASAQDIIDHCHQLIANYKCPRSVDFRVDPMPLSGAGKILKTDLRQPYWDGYEKQVN